VVEHSALDVGDSLRRFNSMVGRGEFVPAGKLLDELRERGLNRLALARMSAYLALRAERLDDARRDYEQVLALLPADREAGLNLAIIDARQGFSSQAEQRLRTLTEHHPDDVQVRAMLNRVRAQGNTP
jgi:Flp pilus assembly protein TadD